MKGILVLIILMHFIFTSCQNRIDLEQLTFKENPKELLKDKKIFEEDREVATTLPSMYTYEGQYFKFNKIDLISHIEPQDQVGFLLKNKKDIVGIYIYIYDIQNDKTQRGNEIFKYLKNKYLGYELLSDSRKKRKNGSGLSGMFNCMWKSDSNRTIIFSQDYGLIDNGKELVSTYIYIVDNNAKTIDDAEETVVNRLKRTYIP